ncbi:MAG: homoserine dehydrogenase [Planctomycetes bacterium]|nr:homoserine dehydrogenase [Planctomycetota bacterium]
MEKVKVAIVGMGTVGTGVARLLLDHGDRTARHAGRILWLEEVVVADLKKARQIDLPKGLLSDDLSRICRNPEIKAVAHLVGGLEPARTIMLRLLESGKDVITANKALLAEHGPELFDRARELGRSIAFEASVAGGIPIVANVSQCLTANQLQSLTAILNGTSNYILTQMEEQEMSYAEALAEAQRLGYAEADPTMDVDGSDTAQKLAILAHLAFGSRTPWREISKRGIDTLDVADLRYARELGYRIKLLAVAQLTGDDLELHVSPTLVKVGTPLAEVRGAFNAIQLVGDAVGPLFYHGLGAGQMPTASAVVADLIDSVVGRTAITFKLLKLWSADAVHGVAARDHAKVRSRYYLRFSVDDRPGVLSEITGVLGNHGISIASVIQHEPSPSDAAVVPLVIITHTTTEGATQQALAEIDRLNCVRSSSVRMGIRQ